MTQLQWDYYKGTWDAQSQAQAEECNLIWRIEVMEDGTFDVNESDSELTNSKVKHKTFSTFAEAARHCQDSENELVADAAMWSRIDGGKVER
jgi:hypothetical protein